MAAALSGGTTRSADAPPGKLPAGASGCIPRYPRRDSCRVLVRGKLGKESETALQHGYADRESVGWCAAGGEEGGAEVKVCARDGCSAGE